jgi:hypothetical protein
MEIVSGGKIEAGASRTARGHENLSRPSRNFFLFDRRTGFRSSCITEQQLTHRAAAIALMTTLSMACASDQGPASAEAPERPPAPIRAFDIATIEELAQRMYAQDRIAARASDVLLARVTEKKATREGVKHWINETRDEHNIVRFIRIHDGVPEAGYDVIFAGLADPSVSVPADRTLTADEVAQYNARTLALENIPNRCSDRYNTVALPDPESDGWLVWTLAATVEPDLVLIGGHYRFTISPDGKTIRARDALSTTCLRFEKKSDSAGSFMSHVVSLTPVETHAFASLTYGKTFHVGTNDGSAWRVDAGRIVRIEQDAPGIDGFAARALAAIEEICTSIVGHGPEGSKTYTYSKPGSAKVIEETEKAEAYSMSDPPEGHVEMVACIRRDIVPSPNDYKVPAAGYELMISDRGAGHEERMGTLKLVDGQFRFEIVDGPPLSDAIAARVRTRLDAFQKAIEMKH